ncbi:ribonuclease H2 subunit A-like [Periplaneta americana]|uniref:ribonuclease H2 subunit A-like n=1 Tax=Periplaneta americana TaxID=6978 RepID=UPI0037E73EF0
MEEENVKISSAEDIETYFVKSDNSQNLMLFSNMPKSCFDEPCLLGVDEAGRGPVLGPMVYGICYCPLSKAEIFKEVGCADSKSLTEEKREIIFGKLCNEQESVGWAIEAISPNNICNSMFRRQKHSLNQVAQDATVKLITKAKESGINISEVYIDTVGMPEKYQEKLTAIFPEFKITVAKKADAIYPVVSAASICAKVSRDRALKIWTFQEGIEATYEDFGSGYPNDPVTKAFLAKNIDPVFGFPQLVRFSWSTAGKILQDHCALVEWEEEDDTNGSSSQTPKISSYFKQASNNKRQKTKHDFFKTRNLSTLESL